MKSALLTIFGVAIASCVAAGPAFASDAPAPDAGVETTTGTQEAADPGAATTDDSMEAATPTLEAVSTDGDTAAELAASDAPADAAGDDSTQAAPALTGDVPLEETPTIEEPSVAPVTLGEIGYDEQGRAGRIHVVVSGDTLWDISDAYLGTPWVWPSVWTDNRDIENPHLIVPGDRIWITASEMRRVTAEEAARLLAGRPLTEDQPASAADTDYGDEPLTDDPMEFVRVSSVETTGFLTSEEYESAASVVDAVSERVMLSQSDQVYIGLGGSEVSVGDQFTVFRTRDKVFDPDTRRLLGYHVDILGWVEVDEPKEETSLASIVLSASEIEIGDRIVRREEPVLDIPIGSSPDGVDGKISFFPSSRVMMGTIDYVYLNRGELDGLEVGSPLEVYRAGWVTDEPARDTEVEVPDRVIAQLLVVRAQPETAVAMVTHTETELQLGDRFRGSAE